MNSILMGYLLILCFLGCLFMILELARIDRFYILTFLLLSFIILSVSIWEMLIFPEAHFTMMGSQYVVTLWYGTIYMMAITIWLLYAVQQTDPWKVIQYGTLIWTTAHLMGLLEDFNCWILNALYYGRHPGKSVFEIFLIWLEAKSNLSMWLVPGIVMVVASFILTKIK